MTVEKANEIVFTVTLDEAQGILAIIGSIPTKSGAWPLLAKLDQQIAQQLNSPKGETVEG